MSHHKLKIKAEFMKAKTFGRKPFEIRFNDRDFQKGDTITYTNDHPNNNLRIDYEGKYKITYVTGYAQKDGWVVFGDRKLK